MDLAEWDEVATISQLSASISATNRVLPGVYELSAISHTRETRGCHTQSAVSLPGHQSAEWSGNAVTSPAFVDAAKWPEQNWRLDS